MSTSLKNLLATIKGSHIGLIITILLVVIIRIEHFSAPFERDEGTYAYFASLLLDGALPYEAFYDSKPAGLFYAYAFIMWLFGDSQINLHFAFLVINLLNVFIVYLLIKKLLNSHSASIGATAFGLVALNPYLGGLSILSEHLLILYASLGMLALSFLTEKNYFKLSFAAGLCMGICLILKQNGLFFIVASALYLLFWTYFHLKLSYASVFKTLAGFGIMTLLPSIVVFAYLFANGLEKEFIYWNYSYSAKYIHDVGLQEGLGFLELILFKIIDGHITWILLGAIGMIFLFTTKVNHVNKVFILLFLTMSLLSITPRWTFHGHYFLFLLPIMSILIAYGYHWLHEYLISSIKGSLGIYVFSMSLIALIGVHLFQNRDYLIDPNYKLLMPQWYGSNPFLETQEVAEKINTLANNGDQLAVFGGEMQLYYYTGLKAPTKHLYGPYLVDGSKEHKQRQKEYMKDLETNLPRFFIAIHHPLTWVIKDNADRGIFHWYGSFTKKNYQLIGLVDMEFGKPSIFHWDEDLQKLPLLGKHQIFIWELRNDEHSLNKLPNTQ